VSETSERRRADLEEKSRATGLSDEEVTELAELERGGPAAVPSKLLAPEPKTRPWQPAFWRSRALGPLGALLVLGGLLVVLVAVFIRKPAVDWRVYEDPAFTFALEHPAGWTTTPVSDRAEAKKGQPARRIDAVIVAPSRNVPDDLGQVLAPGYPGPAYGLAVYNPAPSGGLPILPPADGQGGPVAVRIGGLDAQEVTITSAGHITRFAYGQEGDRLVVFFVTVPESRADELADIFDHARESVRLSEGLEEVPESPRATTRE
jgi:hypothetical protein